MAALREYSISLSRTGGQGSKGDSITDARIENGEIIFTSTRSDGTTFEINAGSLNETFTLDQLQGITIGGLQEGDTLIADANGEFRNYALTPNLIQGVTLDETLTEGDVLMADENGEIRNYQLTTTNILDIDNTGKEEGAVLVYDAATSKYKATTRVEKQETHIIGGSF